VPPNPIAGPRDYGIANLDFKRIAGGLLVETKDELGLDKTQLQVVTKRRPTLEELTDLLFAWRAVRHVRSNAIVLSPAAEPQLESGPRRRAARRPSRSPSGEPAIEPSWRSWPATPTSRSRTESRPRPRPV
jgi:hypothetical protein